MKIHIFPTTAKRGKARFLFPFSVKLMNFHEEQKNNNKGKTKWSEHKKKEK